MNQSAGDRLLRLWPDVAERLAISRSRAYQLAQRGVLPGVVKLGGSVRVSEHRLEEWIEAQSRRDVA